jgi:hypothetical protein
VYSGDVDAFLLVYQEGLPVDDRGTVNLTRTDHRAVRAVSSDGQLMVLGTATVRVVVCTCAGKADPVGVAPSDRPELAKT